MFARLFKKLLTPLRPCEHKSSLEYSWPHYGQVSMLEKAQRSYPDQHLEILQWQAQNHNAARVMCARHYCHRCKKWHGPHRFFLKDPFYWSPEAQAESARMIRAAVGLVS